jgi:pyruvate formate lyase activating enzyme
LELLRETGGITFSGGEPLLQHAELATLARLCKEAGFHTALETCGIVSSESVSALKPYIDTWLVGMRLSTGTDAFDADFLEASTRRTLEILCASPKSEIAVRIPAVFPLAKDKSYAARVKAVLKDFEISKVEILPHNPASELFYEAMGAAPQCRYERAAAEEQYQSMRAFFEQKGSRQKSKAKEVCHETEVVPPNPNVAGEPRQAGVLR